MRRYVLDETRSTFLIWTFRKGLLARLGHDLKIALTALSLELEGRLDEGDWQARFRARLKDLEVLGAVQPGEAVPELRRLLPEALGPEDRLEVRRALGDEVLELARFPEAVFCCRAADRKDAAYHGRLALKDREEPWMVVAHWRREGEALLVEGSAQLLQSAFGIKPYRALGGAIKLRDAIEISFELAFVPEA